MELKELIDIASVRYPDDLIAECYTDPDGPHGDTLAEFIVSELTDTFDPELSRTEQLREAWRVMRNAQRELETLADALEAETILAEENQ